MTEEKEPSPEASSRGSQPDRHAERRQPEGTASESGLHRVPQRTYQGQREWVTAALKSGLFRRVLPLILLVSMVPLLAMGVLNYVGINGVHVQYNGIILNPKEVEAGGVEPKTILAFHLDIGGIKDLAVAGSYEALTDESLKALQLRAVDLSLRVAHFLDERQQDLLSLAAVEPSADTYLAFSRSKRGILWTPDGKFELPLYKEIAFIDTSGQEMIRIVDEKEMPASVMRNVSQPENTTYKRETYFVDTINLGPGEVYAQRLIGWYLPRSVAYAAAENPGGQRYQGVMRFSTPVYENGEKKGILVLSLDWTHGMELVDHEVGSQEGYVAEIPLNPKTGKLAEIYSYMVGDDGWDLSHPRDYSIVGLDGNGEYVPPYNTENRAEQEESGYLPVNANVMQFLGTEKYPHPWPDIAERNRNGQSSGYVPVYYSSKGVPKAMAWATIPYYTQPYNTPAGFGWVGISIDAEKFNETPNALGAAINRRATMLNIWISVVMAAIVLIAIGGISYLIYRMIALPVGNMVALAQRIARGDLAPIEVAEVDNKRNDELAQLQLALAQMLDNLRAIITRIRGAALHMSSSAGEVRATLNEQAGAANQSATAVTETTSTIEELAIIAAQIAERSSSVVEDATATQEDAQTGARAVADTVAKLDEIRAANESNVKEIIALGQKSRRIGEVMELIDNIAARTKLIAFNAALEAAAAGESGQRFSVVAMEVRRLADNVVESTDEIRQRIAEIQVATNALVIASEQEAKRIAEGVAHGQETSEALTEILTSAQSTTLSAEQISLSTKQQRTAAEQVVEAVRSIQTDSQSVARGSKEATHVISDLVQLAAELQRAVEQFELGDQGQEVQRAVGSE
jgi:methyl-accepting chemotaxis protein